MVRDALENPKAVPSGRGRRSLADQGRWPRTTDARWERGRPARSLNPRKSTSSTHVRSRANTNVPTPKFSAGGIILAEATQTFDALGRRIREMIDSDGDGLIDQESIVIFDGWTNWRKDITSSSGTETFYFLGSNTIDDHLAQWSSVTGLSFYLADKQGSIFALIDQFANLQATLDYTAFGQALHQTLADPSSPGHVAALTIPYTFHGREPSPSASVNRRCTSVPGCTTRRRGGLSLWTRASSS